MGQRKVMAMGWCLCVILILSWGIAEAGPFDSLTEKIKGAVKTRTETGADKTKATAAGDVDSKTKEAARTVRGPSAGNIVFSSSPIDSLKPSQLTGGFKAGDPIYAVAYLGKSIKAMSGNLQAKKVDVEISYWTVQKPLYSYQKPSERHIGFSSVSMSGSLLDKNYLSFEILPQAGGMTSYSNPEMTYRKFGKKADGPVKHAEDFAKLEAGRHTIIFKVKIKYAIVSEGDFSLEGEDFSKYLALAEDFRKAQTSQAAADARMPSAAKSDKKLEAEMKAALKASRTFNDRMKGDILRLVIIDDDWYIRRHPLTGAILHRYIRAAAAIRNAKGECILWNLITFQQDYVGGKFQKTRFDGVGDPTPIQCENVK